MGRDPSAALQPMPTGMSSSEHAFQGAVRRVLYCDGISEVDEMFAGCEENLILPVDILSRSELACAGLGGR